MSEQQNIHLQQFLLLKTLKIIQIFEWFLNFPTSKIVANRYIVGCMKWRRVARVIETHSNIVLATNLGQKDFLPTNFIWQIYFLRHFQTCFSDSISVIFIYIYNLFFSSDVSDRFHPFQYCIGDQSGTERFPIYINFEAT